jgi:RimJ/RimL family protein N-acetyltransferase
MTKPAEGVSLVEAEESDLNWILEVERDAVKGGFVSGDPEVRHLSQMADRTCLYMIAKQGAEKIGYVILRGIQGQQPVVELKRIVVAKKDAGIGQGVMRALVKFVFGDLKAHRLWLDVIDDNERAQHVYRKLGFVEEGRFREAALRKEVWRDLVIFGLLAKDYKAA